MKEPHQSPKPWRSTSLWLDCFYLVIIFSIFSSPPSIYILYFPFSVVANKAATSDYLFIYLFILLWLFMIGNNIGDEGAKSIAEALQINKSLTELDLSRNYFLYFLLPPIYILYFPFLCCFYYGEIKKVNVWFVCYLGWVFVDIILGVNCLYPTPWLSWLAFLLCVDFLFVRDSCLPLVDWILLGLYFCVFCKIFYCIYFQEGMISVWRLRLNLGLDLVFFSWLGNLIEDDGSIAISDGLKNNNTLTRMNLYCMRLWFYQFFYINEIKGDMGLRDGHFWISIYFVVVFAVRLLVD